MFNGSRKLITSAIASAIALHAMPASSQEVVLEEIIVTAQKRTESLQDVPISVSVLGGQELAEANIINLQDMSQYVPNFYQVRTPTSNVIFIRGIGSSPNAGFEQSVGMFYDNIYMSRPRQTLTPFYDLARVEVLRGPQSILFGKNTSAGAVSLISAQPTREFEASINALAGTQGEAKIQAVVSGPLSDTLSGRVALYGRHLDGWTENSFDDSTGPETDDYGLRAILAFEPSETFSGALKVERSKAKMQGAAYELSKNSQIGPLPTPPSPFTFIPPQLTGIEDRLDHKGNFGNTAPLPGDTVYTNTTIDNVSLDMDFQLGEHTLTSVTGYSAYDFRGISDLDQSPANLIGADQKDNYTQWSQELRITSPLGNTFDYIGGIYLQSGRLDIEQDVGFQLSTIGAPAEVNGGRFQTFDQSSDSASAFFQGTWNTTDNLRLKFGLRYTYEKKKLERENYAKNFLGMRIVPGRSVIDDLLTDFWLDSVDTYPYEVSPDRNESNWSPMLGVEWNISSDVMFYASATQGFKSGGWDSVHSNGLRLEELEFDNESSNAFEVGTKTAFWGNRATVNVAVFLTKFKDLQVSTFNGSSGFNVSNAAEATSKGVELDSRFLLTPDLVVTANLAYLNYKYDDYDGAPCTTAQLSTQLITTGGTEGCINDLSGETVTYAPTWSGALSGTYTLDVSNALEMRFTLDANFRSKYFLEADLDENAVQDAYWVLNGRMILAASAGTWDVALVGRNLTDTKTASTGGDVPFGNGTSFGVPDFRGSYYKVMDRPRSFALEGTYRFF